MNEDTFSQLSAMSQHLQERASALAGQGKDNDLATLMSAQALTIEALKALGETLNKINGPLGLGAAGD